MPCAITLTVDNEFPTDLPEYPSAGFLVKYTEHGLQEVLCDSDARCK